MKVVNISRPWMNKFSSRSESRILLAIHYQHVTSPTWDSELSYMLVLPALKPEFDSKQSSTGNERKLAISEHFCPETTLISYKPHYVC